MSLEVIENNIKNKLQGIGGTFNASGQTVHEHSSAQLLYPYTLQDLGKKDENGEVILERVIDVDSRTELPNPSGTTVLESYGTYLDKVFGKGKGNGMRNVNIRYKVNMTSKDGNGRKQFTQIATGAAYSEQGDNGKNNIIQAVGKQ